MFSLPKPFGHDFDLDLIAGNDGDVDHGWGIVLGIASGQTTDL